MKSLGLLLGAIVGFQAPTIGEVRQGLAMGTVLRMEGDVGLEAGWAECSRIEAATSTWREDSVFSRLNGAGGKPVEVTGEWMELLAKAQAFSVRSKGTFDPVLGALLRAWGTREGGRQPSASELAQARAASGSRLLALDPTAGTARLEHPRAAVEEGGFVKGYALDRMASAMKGQGARSGLLDLGGQLLCFGTPRRVSIAHVRHRTRARFSLKLKDASLATSGTSERGRHLLDPRTGSPCPAWGSVSVVAPTALEADLLTKPCYILGPDAGSRWAEKEGIAALFQRADGRVRMTAAFRKLRIR